MNEILAKNLACIKKYNKKLAQQIENINVLSQKIELCLTSKNEHNVCINDIPVHSQNGAQEEAEQIYASLPHNDDSSIHVTFGLGLGYLFQELCDKAKGSIILYEDNLDLLRAVFEVVDFSQTLNKPNVKIVSNTDDLKQAYYSFYTGTAKISLTFLNYYKNNFLSQINKVLQELQVAQGIASSSYKFKTQRSNTFAKAIINKLDKKIKMPCITTLKDKFKNMPAVVVSAGASLYDNLELLKKYQDKVVIFCVGTAYKALRNAGIKPDFLCIVEACNVSNQVDGTKTNDVNFITEPTTHSALLDYEYKNTFIYPSRENNVNWWFLDLINEGDTTFETKGTVAYNALFSAYKSGCNPIILIGQDLAYVNDCCYSKNSPYASLKCRYSEENKKWEVYSDNFDELVGTLMMNTGYTKEDATQRTINRISRMTSSLGITQGQDGKDVRTDVSYILFAQYFADFAKRFSNNVTLINSSKGGLNIEGFENKDFEQTLNQYAQNSINIDEIIQDTVQNYKIDYDIINKKISDEIVLFKEILNDIRKLEHDLSNIKLQIQNPKKPIAQTQNSLKKCLDFYMQLTTKHRQLNSLYLALTFREDESVATFLKNNTQSFTLNSIVELCTLLNNYFEVAKNETNLFVQELEKTKDKINESTYTAC